MRTISFEGTVTAVTSVIHGSGENNGNASLLRREKFVQPNGSVEAVPVISGNAIRGTLRDVGMFDMLRKLGYGVKEETKEVKGLPLSAFYFLFSGGALTSTGETGINIERFREMREKIPLIGVFGGAIGNAIMPGKMKIGKMIPICQETMHLLPEKFRNENAESIWEYCQTEQFTRKDDEKNDKVRMMIDADVRKLIGDGTSKKDITGAGAQQMIYRIETLAAGTQFYWKITLEDATDVEFEALVNTLLVFSKTPYVGGKSGTGHGELAIQFDNWVEIDSRANLQGTEVDMPLLKKYYQHLQDNKDEIKVILEGIK